MESLEYDVATAVSAVIPTMLAIVEEASIWLLAGDVHANRCVAVLSAMTIVVANKAFIAVMNEVTV